jgi:hypothetical protein
MMMRLGWYGFRLRFWLGIFALSGAALMSSAEFGLAATARQETFAAPETAVDALIAATRAGKTAELLKILGPGAEKLIKSGDPVADKTARTHFVAAYDASHSLETEGPKALLIIGPENWPFPIPLVRQGSVWRFDTAAGKQEILNRRIGRNELSVIEVCRAYVEAQREYAAKDRLGSGTLEYAQHFVSAPGKHDGLYWETSGGEEQSPLGPLVAEARAEGYDGRTPHVKPRPYHGYYYKIIKRQGPHAPGGAKDYVVDGHMTGGFALVAFPAKYGDSGVMTFMVNQTGIVYEKNLGPETAKIAANLTEYDPDDSWTAP